MHSAVAISFLILLYSTSSIHASDVWTLNCDPLSIQRADPIVSPGVASGHVHAIVGGTAFNRTMSGNDSAVGALATTCDKFTDHSNYWCPQLYQMANGMFSLVTFTGANMYYENYTCDYDPANPGYCDSSKPRQARAFPPGFRMIAGDSERRTNNVSDQTNQAILFTNGNQKNVYGIPTVLDGGDFQAAVRFPSCWNGLTVDSPDHKSHVAYPDPNFHGDTTGGMCPESHPLALINIGAEFGFALNGITDPQSLVFANGDTTGFGFHGDFLQGWTNSSALQASFSNCFTNDDCPWRQFGTPNGEDGVKTPLSPQIPAIYPEEIGLNGPIPTLPGNNPVYTAPGSSGASSSALSSVITLNTSTTTSEILTTTLPVSSTIISIPSCPTQAAITVTVTSVSVSVSRTTITVTVAHPHPTA